MESTRQLFLQVFRLIDEGMAFLNPMELVEEKSKRYNDAKQSTGNEMTRIEIIQSLGIKEEKDTSA
jgi:hypothetical protein